MRTLRVGAAAINTTPLDWERNVRNTLAAIREAAAEGVSVLCLPEMCLTGYGCEDAFHAPFVAEAAGNMLGEISRSPVVAAREKDIVFCVGVPVYFQNALFNCVAVFRNDHLLGYVAKQHLAGDGLHYEPRWFRPWPKGHRDVLRVDGREIPIGDLVFDIDGVRIGFEICEDAWVANRPGVDLARKGVDIILNPSASHFAFGKHGIRERFVVEGSRAFGATYVYANLLGNEAGRAVYDGDTIIATGGRLVGRGKRFSYGDVVVAHADVDIEATRVVQARTASFTPSFDEDGVVHIQGLSCLGCQDRGRASLSPAIPLDVEDAGFRETEFAKAVPLALFDYMRKSGQRGFVVSLSGGADSAICAALVRLMVRDGIAELGRRGFYSKIGRHPDLDGDSEEAVVHGLLTCVYQASENSSQTTADAARAVATGLGAEYHHIDVSEIIRSYTSVVSGTLGLDLTWAKADITLQNIQARSRAPSIWMFANLQSKLLLATSNRSEASVGYCTMDGDTAGCLAPIGGIDKPFVRSFLRHLCENDPDFACLKPVVVQQPTAELRPASDQQTDEKDLMPYEVLDAAERAAIRDKRSPADVFRVLLDTFPQYDLDTLHVWVERYFKLWVRNQWKRERLAPSFHVDDENLDPKTWCRFPLLSGGYAHELRQLGAYVQSMKLGEGIKT